MFFWVPVIAILSIIVIAIIWSIREGGWDILGGGLLISLAIGILSVVVCAVALSSTLNDRRQIGTPEALVKFEDGNYIESRYIGDEHWLTIQVVKDGRATIISSFQEGDYDIITGKPTAEIVKIQKYTDNQWMWPWFLEGGSVKEIYIPDGSIVEK